MNRREFIKETTLAAGLLPAASVLNASDGEVILSINHKVGEINHNNRYYEPKNLASEFKKMVGKPITVNFDENHKAGLISEVEIRKDGVVKIAGNIYDKKVIKLLKNPMTICTTAGTVEDEDIKMRLDGVTEIHKFKMTQVSIVENKGE